MTLTILVVLAALSFSSLATDVIHLERKDVCTVYTLVESVTIINTCFTANTMLSIDHCTDITITDAPTCLTTTLTVTATFTKPVAAHSV